MANHNENIFVFSNPSGLSCRLYLLLYFKKAVILKTNKNTHFALEHFTQSKSLLMLCSSQ